MHEKVHQEGQVHAALPFGLLTWQCQQHDSRGAWVVSPMLHSRAAGLPGTSGSLPVNVQAG